MFTNHEAEGSSPSGGANSTWDALPDLTPVVRRIDGEALIYLWDVSSEAEQRIVYPRAAGSIPARLAIFMPL